MGTYQHAFVTESLAHLGNDVALPRVAIETGTCLGYSTEELALRFERVHTIEISPNLSQQAQARLGAYDSIRFHVGDSSVLLPSVLATLTEPALLFLDAHWSGDRTTNWESSAWKGYPVPTAHAGLTDRPSSEEQVPLLEELRAAAEHPHACVVYVDDWEQFDDQGHGRRNHGFPGCDWSHLSIDVLLDAIASRRPRIHVSDDRTQACILLP